MKDPHIEIIIDPDGQTLAKRLEDVLRAYETVARRIDKAFQAADMSGAVRDMVRLGKYTEKFSGQLLYLRLNLGRLKAALSDAFAPIGAYILPVINRVIHRLGTFLQTIGAVLAAVMDNVTGTDSAAKSADKAAKSYKNWGSAAKKSLAGFDQIQRLNGAAGTGSTGSYGPLTRLTADVKDMVNRVLGFLQPLLRIDLTPLRTAMQNLWAAVSPWLQKLGEGLRFLWQAVAAPFIAWCVQTLLPVFTGVLTKAFQAVSNATGPLVTGLKLIWDALQPVVAFIKEAVIRCLTSWRQIFAELALQLEEKGPAICTVFNGIGTVIRTMWNAISPILTALYTQFQNTFAGLGKVATQVFGAILEGLAGLSEFVAGVFTADWKRAWNGILLFFKSIVNSLIGLLNAMLVKLTGALNGVVRMANKLQFTVPQWVPGIGGERFGFSLKTVTAPQIPYLAKGAVLPANKPFLAMVGDQRHGTNIEAPLSTIRQAVADVMGDYADANMAGHGATVQVLGEILQAVLGIEIGDSVIAGALSRHQAKMAVVRGGMV